MCDQSNNNCDICGLDCDFDYHICQCGKVVCLNCTKACDCCGQLFCKSCFEAAKKIGGGLNAAHTGWHICYSCTKSGSFKRMLIAEAETEAIGIGSKM